VAIYGVLVSREDWFHAKNCSSPDMVSRGGRGEAVVFSRKGAKFERRKELFLAGGTERRRFFISRKGAEFERRKD
jgi:hypothetical protein